MANIGSSLPINMVIDLPCRPQPSLIFIQAQIGKIENKQYSHVETLKQLLKPSWVAFLVPNWSLDHVVDLWPHEKPKAKAILEKRQT